MKISEEQSRRIYELAKDPKNELSNTAIGKMFGITEAAVRYHIKRWEDELHEIARTNEKAASALASHAVNVTSEAVNILTEVKGSIREAKQQGVSPERLAPLYNNWIRSLELASELLGDLDRSPQVNIQVNQQFNEFMKVILEEVDHDTRAKIIRRLRPDAIY
jgi:predicted transcriptional regulator